jgi:hypothetical protein
MSAPDVVRALADAADAFPVGSPPPGLAARVALRRRTVRVRRGSAVLVAAAAAAGIALGVPGVADRVRPTEHVAGSPQAFPTGRWVLTRVDGPDGSTVVPTSLRATLEFSPNRMIVLDNTWNALSGHYVRHGDDFTIQGDVGTTFVGEGEGDDVQRTAQGAINTIAYGHAEAAGPRVPVTCRVSRLDDQRLVVQTGTLRLEFEPSPAPSGS